MAFAKNTLAHNNKTCGNVINSNAHHRNLQHLDSTETGPFYEAKALRDYCKFNYKSRGDASKQVRARLLLIDHRQRDGPLSYTRDR